MVKPILCLDFDGVINSYTSGWIEAYFIPDPPVRGAMEFIVEASEHFDVHVFSSRSHQEGGIQAMKTYIGYWMRKEFSSFDETAPAYIGKANGALNNLKFPLEKPTAMVTIDDRAITFTGKWPAIMTLLAFKPWNKI